MVGRVNRRSGASSRVGWVVSKMVTGRVYTAKDIQEMFDSRAPYPPVDRKQAKSMVYGILRSKRYITQASDVKRKGVILLRAADAPALPTSATPMFLDVFNRACIKAMPRNQRPSICM